MLSFRQPRVAIAALALCLGLAGAPVAAATDLTVQAVEVSVAPAGEGAQVTFRVAISNPGETGASNVHVVFADGVDSYVGDVAAGGKGTTQAETRTLESSQLITANVPLSIKLTYAQGDEQVEQPATVIVRVK